MLMLSIFQYIFLLLYFNYYVQNLLSKSKSFLNILSSATFMLLCGCSPLFQTKLLLEQGVRENYDEKKHRGAFSAESMNQEAKLAQLAHWDGESGVSRILQGLVCLDMFFQNIRSAGIKHYINQEHFSNPSYQLYWGYLKRRKDVVAKMQLDQ